MIYRNLDWWDFKNVLESRQLSCHYIELLTRYEVFCFDGPMSLSCVIQKLETPASEQQDFELNYKPTANSKIDKRDSDGTPLFNLQKTGVTVDKGEANFDTVVSHNWIDNTTWPSPSDSTWMNEASAPNKQLIIPKAEVQFTHDVRMKTAVNQSELYFDIWAYNPLVDLESPLDPEDPLFVPGVSSGNPLRFLVKRNVFTSLKEVFDFGNDHYTLPVAVDGLPSGVTTVRFDYDQKIVLRGDQGAQIRFSLKDHSPMEGGVGSFCTVSLVIREEDIT